MPLKLDLNDLTPDHVREALPNMGQCHYNAPCIIGTLIPEDQRAAFDASFITPTISELINKGRVEFADDEQAAVAQRLQSAFDCGYEDEFLAILRNDLNMEIQL